MSAPAPPSPRPDESLARAARATLHVGVGLAVLAVQQFQADRPQLEADLRALGLHGLARATERAGGFVEGQVARLLGLSRPAR